MSFLEPSSLFIFRHKASCRRWSAGRVDTRRALRALIFYYIVKKRALQKRPIFCKETYILKHPINRSHPISAPSTSPTHFFLPSCFAPQVARHGRLLRRLPLLRRLSQPRPISFLFPFYYPFLRLLTAPAATSTTFFASPHSHFFFLRSVPTAASTASTYFHKMFDPIISNSFPVRYYGISGTNFVYIDRGSS